MTRPNIKGDDRDRNFDEEMISIGDPDGTGATDVYLSRASCNRGDELRGRAILTVVNHSLCVDVITLSSEDLMKIARLMAAYARKLDAEKP
jgi:hypothetical protein